MLEFSINVLQVKHKNMKENQIIIGIDVSKKTLDVCLLQKNQMSHAKIENNEKKIKQFFSKVSKEHPDKELIFGMENTGYYNWALYAYLETTQHRVYVISALHLKRSMGISRGKNDQIDAQRIASFIKLHHADLSPFIIPRKIIRKLQALLAYRNRLVKIKSMLCVPHSELSDLNEKDILKAINQSSKFAIAQLDKQIEKTEEIIDKLIACDEELCTKYKYIISVRSVGKVLAWYMLIKTNEFKSINNPRKLACYAGVVPFEHQSGTSINRKPKVSYMADKTLKKMLHLAAMSAIQYNAELKNYYHRKLAEGKSKMSVINAVRNKLVLRICSVVNNQRIYQTNLDMS